MEKQNARTVACSRIRQNAGSLARILANAATRASEAPPQTDQISLFVVTRFSGSGPAEAGHYKQRNLVGLRRSLASPCSRIRQNAGERSRILANATTSNCSGILLFHRRLPV